MKNIRLFVILPLVPILPAMVGCVEHAPSSAAVLRSGDESEPAAAALPVEEQPEPAPVKSAADAGSKAEVQGEPVDTAAAPSKPAPVGKAPPADRTPTRPGDAEKITFDDLNLGMQADVVFRPFMLTDRVNDLAGKRISIIGYMHGGQASLRGIKDFILLKNTQCKFGPGGQADHLTNVILRDGTATTFTPNPLKIEGTLKIEPFQGPDNNTWSIYRLEDAQIR